MGTTSSSPYEIGEPVKTRLTSRGWHWVQHEGKRRAGTTSTRSSAAARGGVSIFKASLKELSQDKATLAKHAFAKTKMLRHPHILEFLEGNDGDSEVMLVTEAVTPLPDWLEQQRRSMSSLDGGGGDNDDEDKDEEEGASDKRAPTAEQIVAVTVWGIKCVLEALGFLHQQGMVHGLVCAESIFVTRAGDFKLWGLDVAVAAGGPEWGFFQSAERQQGRVGAHFDPRFANTVFSS